MYLSFTFSAPSPLRLYGYARFNFGRIGSIRVWAVGRIRRVRRSTRSLIIGLRVVRGGRCGADSCAYGKTCHGGAGAIIRIGATINVRI
jgi:hypothetical protein